MGRPTWAPAMIASMLLALFYAALRFLVELLVLRQQPDARLRVEVLALRHQLRVLERQIRRPRWQSADRLLLAALSRALPRSSWQRLLVSPETLLRWHRELVRRKWALYAARRRSSASAPSDFQERSSAWRGRTQGGDIAASRVSSRSSVIAAPISPSGTYSVAITHPRHRAAASAPGATSSASTPINF